MKMEDLREQQKNTAYNMVKTQLVLEAVMKNEEISASLEEVEDYIIKAAEKAKKSVEEYKKLIGPDALEGIQDRLAMDKTISMIMENASLTEEKETKAKTKNRNKLKRKMMKKNLKNKGKNRYYKYWRKKHKRNSKHCCVR